MVDILIYFVIILGIAFMVYQTHKFVLELKRANNKGHKKDVYVFSAILIILWVIYLFAVIYTLLVK
ncbi:hypothetical protein QI349_02745 [Staphylococcus saprophyticus]|nr:hypothetical protein [Staphylococcus saprophyticus]